MKNSATILLFLFLSGPLFAQPVTITVNNTNGDQSAGSLGSAVTALNANAGGGSITFTVPASSTITLTQPLSGLTQSATFQGNSVTVTNGGGMDTQVLSSSSLAFDSNVTMGVSSGPGTVGAAGAVTHGGIGGMGGGSAVTALSLDLNPSSFFQMGAGAGGAGGNSVSFIGGRGGVGGTAGVTTGNLNLGSGAILNLTGGQGGNGGLGVIYGDGGLGGVASLVAGAVTLQSNSAVSLMGGKGGSTAQQIGGLGGAASLSITSLQLSSGSTLVVTGGTGGSGFINGAGGTALVQMGSVTVNSGAFFKVVGGTGGTGNTAGPGGDAVVTIGSLVLNGSDFQAVGGSGVSTGNGGNASVSIGNLMVGAGDHFNVIGGTPGLSGGLVGNASSAIDSLNGSGSVSLNGGFTFLFIQSGNFSGVISGTEALQKIGSGALTLTGSNLYTNSTIIKGGTLVFASTANLGTSGTLFTLDGGTAKITSTILTGKDVYLGANGGGMDTNGNILCIGGTVSGLGGLEKVGSGALTLLGSNTYSGGTTLTGGTVDVGADNNLGTGDLTFNGGTLQLTSSFNTGKALDVTSNGGIFDTQAFDMAVTGVVSGTGALNKMGSGILGLQGVGTYTGLATVSSGILMVGDVNHATAQILGGVNVLGGATLMGHGTIGGLVVNDGTLQPGGDSIGTLSVGNFTQSVNGTLLLEISPTQASHLTVVGNTQLDGTLFVAEDAGNYGIRYRYVILDSGSSLLGTFVTVTDSLSYMDSLLAYGSNSVTLTLTRNNADFTAFANGANELSVAAALNASIPTATDAFIDKLNKIYEMPSGQSAVLSQLGGLIYSALPSVLLDHLQFQDDLLFGRLNQTGGMDGGRVLSSLVGGSLSADATGPTAGLGSAANKGVWLKSLDSFGSVKATADVPGFNQSNLGLLAGYDVEFAKGLTAGLMGGYLRTEVTSLDKTAKTGVDGYQGGFYGSGRMGDLEIALTGGFGIDKFQTDRTITMGTDYNQMTGKTDGSHIIGALQLDYRVKRSGFLVRPLVGVQYAHLTVKSVTESGSTSLALSIPAGDYDSIRPYAGLNASKAFQLGGQSQLIPQIEFSASEELMNTQAQFQTAFNGASANSFTITGITPDKTVLGVGAGLDFVAGNWGLFAHYNGHFSGSQNLHTVNGGVNLAF